MTQPNESLGMTAADHIRTIYRYARGPIFDSAVVNLASISPLLRESYRGKGAEQVEVDAEAIQALGVIPVLGAFLEEHSGIARHAAEAVSSALLGQAFNRVPVQDVTAAPLDI